MPKTAFEYIDALKRYVCSDGRTCHSHKGVSPLNNMQYLPLNTTTKDHLNKLLSSIHVPEVGFPR
jgi:hypothetical protein